MVSREEAKKQLVTFGISEPTEQQITDYLNNVNAEAVKEKAKADKYKTDAEKAEELQRQLDALQTQGLSDLEKANKANEALQAQIATLTTNSFKSEAKGILKGFGFDDETIEALLPGMIADTLENTTARANAYVTAMNKVRENAIKEKEKSDLDGTGTPGSGKPPEDKKSEAELFAEGMVKANSSDAKGADAILSNYK